MHKDPLAHKTKVSLQITDFGPRVLENLPVIAVILEISNRN
jgi:hypothetical protein